MNVLSAIKARRCTRAFLETPVPEAIIKAIFDAARWAPSGKNTQPWQVAVLTGKTKHALSHDIIRAFRSGVAANPDYRYYALSNKGGVFWQRAIACGLALYSALGIKREDHLRRKEVWEWNYSFFGAPVGLIFYLDKDVEKGSWMDMGMFLQNVMLAAQAYGLSTCPQASIAEYPDLVRKHLNVSNQHHIVCGMALGFPDNAKVINQYRTEREVVDNFLHFFD